MIPKRIRSAFRTWLYCKICYPEQLEVLELLDTMVQDAQGMLLQLQAVSQLIAADSPAKAGMEATLMRAETLLDSVRDRAEIQASRFRTHSGERAKVQ